jgi:DDE_Tnp_1-associated
LHENGDKTTGKRNVTMQEDELNSLIDAFKDLPDPRSERNQYHPLMSILFIAICGAISGAENWVDIEAYGKAKQAWLETLIALPHGIPSHDTFGRVFRFMNPQAFQERFLGWVRQVRSVTTGEGATVKVCIPFSRRNWLNIVDLFRNKQNKKQPIKREYACGCSVSKEKDFAILSNILLSLTRICT